VKGKAGWSIFWVLVGVFTIEMVVIFIGAANTYTLFGGMGILFSLGVALLVLTIRTGVKGKLKGFLLLTGAAPVAMVIFAVLHNLVYALAISAFGAGFWNGGDEPFFFIMAIIICPIAFLSGAVGSIVLTMRTKPNVPAATP